MPFCSAIAASTGVGCGFAARRDSGLCINHDPAYHARQQQNVRKGASASLEARYRPNIRIHTVDLFDSDGIQRLIEAVVRSEIDGGLPGRHARIVLRAVSLALRNLERQARLPKPRHDHLADLNAYLAANAARRRASRPARPRLSLRPPPRADDDPWELDLEEEAASPPLLRNQEEPR